MSLTFSAARPPALRFNSPKFGNVGTIVNPQGETVTSITILDQGPKGDKGDPGDLQGLPDFLLSVQGILS